MTDEAYGPDEIVQAVIGKNAIQAAEHREGASTRSVVLMTGMSGSGKPKVLAELKRCGRRVIDTDDPGWIVETHTVTVTTSMLSCC